jgi:tRNA 2-selenouridine synthase
MAHRIDTNEFLQFDTIIDVRSPSEYAHGHIPGALNIPLFTDQERAEVGTLYTRAGKQTAVLKGLELVGPKLKHFVKQAAEIAKKQVIAVYCWRGGMRSASMAFLFETAGLETYVLKGGYKAYRKHALDYFGHTFKLNILGGMTGSGKTEILYELQKIGEQIIDLESLANHKGSSFGALGQLPQPTTEHFSNLIYQKLSVLDALKPIWIEDESYSIGSCYIPDPLFKTMCQATAYVVGTHKTVRINRLEQEYGGFDQSMLTEAVKRIQKRLGNDITEKIIEHITTQQISAAIDHVLTYYDKSYNFALDKRGGNCIRIETDGLNLQQIAAHLKTLAL